MKKRLAEAKGAWPDKLLGTLWSMRTNPNSGTKDTSFTLAFGHEAIIPAEICSKTFRVTKYSKRANEQALRENLDLIEERNALASINTVPRKQQAANYYNKRVKPRNFQVGDWVLRSSTVRAKKRSQACKGPYIIAEVIGK